MPALHRRNFLKAGSALTLASSTTIINTAFAQQRSFNPLPGNWRTFEITTRVDLLEHQGNTLVWLPIPSVNSSYQQSLKSHWQGNANKLSQVADTRQSNTQILMAEFSPEQDKPWLELTNRFRTQSRAVDWNGHVAAKEKPAVLQYWLQATDLQPTDGIVQKTALQITQNARTDEEKVRQLYDWVVNNTYREPKIRGCGVGNIKAMLETGNLGGKCGDINALFVGLCRAAGVPARDVYGIRLVPSSFGYKELSGNPGNLTKAQHCRAEVYLVRHGWVAMDPADVGKVMRQETPEWIKATNHPIISSVYKSLFGGWEGNWLAFNTAFDLNLPGAQGPKLGFFMYPTAENANGRLDSLAPDQFKYQISAREIMV